MSLDSLSRDADGPRFLQLSDVAQILSVSDTQVYALVRSGELRAIKLGGRGRWRVERTELQAYIDRMYDQTRAFIESHPFARTDVEGDPDADAELLEAEGHRTQLG